MNREIMGKPLRWHIVQWTVFFICFSLTAVLGVLSVKDVNGMILYVGDTDFGFNFHALAFLIFAGLFGQVPAYACTVLVFLVCIFLRPGEAYQVSAALLATILFSRAGRKQVFRKKGRCFWLFVRSSVLLGILNTALIMLQGYDFNLHIMAGTWSTILASMPECLIATVFCYLFFTKTPDRVKERVANGLIYYNREVEEDEIRRRVFLKNRLGTRITAIVLAESIILVCSAMGFTTVLLPDLHRMNQRRAAGEQAIDWLEMPEGIRLPFDMLRKEWETEISSEAEEPVESSENTEVSVSIAEDGPPEIDEGIIFAANNYGLAYMLKLGLMLLCMAVPVAAFADFYTQSRVVIPVTGLSAAMVRFSRKKKDELESYASEVNSLNIRTRDEIEELYHAVDGMVQEMVHYIERLEEEQKLKEDLRVAEAASKAKSEFLSNMSHEIRTPINAVLGLDEMILRESGEEETLRYAHDIKNAGNTLLGIINDILDSSKIESGKMEILPVTYELASTINDLVNMISQKAQDKGLDLIIHVDETIPHLLIGDEIRIKQCVLNILTNAVKYTEKGSVTLTVGWRREDEEHIFLSFRVEDTGIGIREEDLSKLFSPFERIEEIRNRTIEGTGLGMSIVKQLLAMMDTKLTVKSVYGEGSDFSFEVRQEVQDPTPVGSFEDSYRRALEEQEGYEALFTAPEGRILVTDDTLMNLTVIKGLLKETLLQVDTATSGKETLDKICKERYDVILLDHRMPEMDGIETKEAMETLEGNLNADTPVIALTANAVSGARDRYLAAGFIDYLSKPVDAKKLEKMLTTYLPKEKCHLRGEEGYVKQKKDAGKEEELPEELKRLKGIDPGTALKNCGSKEVFLEAAENFLTALPENAKKIEEYANSGDFRNYTVLVHALKSSARLLGATELSEKAAWLEAKGNEENREEIHEKTPELLALYRSYQELLSPLKPDEKEEKPAISEEELAEAYMGMREFVDAFDFDSAGRIMEMLKGYKIPDTEVDKYDKIKKCMAAVDRDALLALL
ncbi:MAG: response regulator [Lachnospiraceae bacterium]|nr:response regulator [Lachnospiraceae bacterium]